MSRKKNKKGPIRNKKQVEEILLSRIAKLKELTTNETYARLCKGPVVDLRLHCGEIAKIVCNILAEDSSGGKPLLHQLKIDAQFQLYPTTDFKKKHIKLPEGGTISLRIALVNGRR